MTILHITIRRNADGVIRTVHWLDWIPWKESDVFWWSGGNYSCDCNRKDNFDRAGGDPVQDESECGDDAYTVLSITQDDDPTVLYADDLERTT